MNRKNIIHFILYCFLSIFILSIGRYYLLPKMGTFLVVRDRLQPADVIVVLSGGNGRVEQAIKLYKEGYSKFLIMSGSTENSLTHITDQMKQEAMQAGVPAERILLEPKAEHTYQHPVFIEPILRSHGFTSAIIVSSSYHMRRVAMLFDHELTKKGIKLIYYPVMNSWFDAQHWWQSDKSRSIVYREYIKMAVNFWGTGFSDFTCVLIKDFKSL